MSQKRREMRGQYKEELLSQYYEDLKRKQKKGEGKELPSELGRQKKGEMTVEEIE